MLEKIHKWDVEWMVRTRWGYYPPHGANLYTYTFGLVIMDVSGECWDRTFEFVFMFCMMCSNIRLFLFLMLSADCTNLKAFEMLQLFPTVIEIQDMLKTNQAFRNSFMLFLGWEWNGVKVVRKALLLIIASWNWNWFASFQELEIQLNRNYECLVCCVLLYSLVKEKKSVPGSWQAILTFV